MQHNIPNPDAFARRDTLRKKSLEITERAGRLTALKADRDQAQNELDALMRSDAEQLTAWARAGATGKPPAPDARVREAALRKLANAEQNAHSVDAALSTLQEESRRIAEELQAAGNEVRIIRAQHLAQLLVELTARRREIEDERAIVDAVAGRVQAALLAADGQIATQSLNELEAERVGWINTRGAQIDGAVASRMADLAKDFPA